MSNININISQYCIRNGKKEGSGLEEVIKDDYQISVLNNSVGDSDNGLQCPQCYG